MIDQKEIDEISKIKSKVRGEIINGSAEYISDKEGEERLEKVNKQMEKLGYSFEHNVSSTGWVPLEKFVAVLICTKDSLGWKDEDIVKMGNSLTKKSFLVKTFLKFVLSPQKVFNSADKYWRKYFTAGELVPSEFDSNEGYAKINLKGFDIHPVMCPLLKGYWGGVAELVLTTDSYTLEETKCVHKGDDYHQFVFKWEP